MGTAKVMSGGRITLPADVRRAMDEVPGSGIRFDEVEPGRFHLVITQPITALKGMLGKPKRRLTVEQMNAVIARRGAGLVR